MFLSIGRNDGDMIPPYDLPESFRVDTSVQSEALDTVVEPWIITMARLMSCVSQQYSARSHTAQNAQYWPANNFIFTTPYLPTCSP